jgi:hypothetical protein
MLRQTLNPVRRIISIFFLFLFLFNVGGYYLVFLGMKTKAKKELLARLDANDYTADETLVLSVPLSMPYPIHSAGYERVEGDFEQQGRAYKLVKQKIENDTLFIVCIRDDKSTKIINAFQDFSKVANNLPVASKEALNFLAKLYTDYNTSEFVFHYKSRYLFEQTYYAQSSPSLDDVAFMVDSPPPETRF